jgi:RHS repeat-associated protein
MRWASGRVISSTALGMKGSLYDGDVRSRCTGKERDAESGLDYFGARYYASNMGRMTSPDPLAGHLANPQSLNRYAYVLNNPLSNTDPTGMYVCEDSTNCDSKNDKAFAKGLADAQTAANALKDQYGANSSEYTSAQKAIDSYGAQGVDNGVNVRFDSNVSGGVTEVSGVAGDKTADNPNGQNINVTFNPNAVGGTLDDGLVAHEGSHVADGSAWVSSGFSPGMDPTRYQTEIHAYQVQYNIMQGTPGFNMMMGTNIGGVPVIPGVPWQDARPDFQNMLKTNPQYKLTYKDTTAAFVKGAAPQ